MLSSSAVLKKTHGDGKQAEHDESHKGDQTCLKITQAEIGLKLAGQWSRNISESHDQESQENGN